MSLNEEPTQPLEKWPTNLQTEAVKLIDPLYTFMARSEIYGAAANLLALENLAENKPMDEIEERFIKAVTTYLTDLISEYGDD